MSYEVIPAGQETTINPYSNKLLNFDTASSRLYSSRAINSLFKAIGNDCILEGLTTTAQFINNNSQVRIIVKPGKAIIDSTLIDIISQSTLVFDVSVLNDQNGYLLAFLSYMYVGTAAPNKCKIKYVYHNSASDLIVPSDVFQPDMDRILLCKYAFDTTSNTLTKIESELFNPHIHTIYSKDYVLFPRSALTKSAFLDIANMFTIINYI